MKQHFAAVLVVGFLLLASGPSASADGNLIAPAAVQDVLGYASNNYYIWTRPGPHAVAVSGNGTTRFNVYLYDGYNRLIASRLNQPSANLAWTARDGGNFKVVLQGTTPARTLIYVQVR